MKEKNLEAVRSVLPITVIVFLICFLLIPVPSNAMLAFILGALMLVVGMGLFTLGTERAMTPIGQEVGQALTRSRNIKLILIAGFAVGAMVTISEPDLNVLAGQVSGVPNMVLILAVALGVGLFLMLALIRILFKIKMSLLLMISYGAVFLLSLFVPGDFLAVAFDSGGVTTGPMTVPFILALGVGVSSIRSDRDAEGDSFGLVALSSIGPILAVMLLSIFYHPGETESSTIQMIEAGDSLLIFRTFLQALPEYAADVGIALLPIVLFFVIFQFASLHLPANRVIKICIGLLYTYVGLVLFLTGVNVGFMPVGNYIGKLLGQTSYKWILVPLGGLIGWFVVSAEPAVHVLNDQVYTMTAGAVPKSALRLSLSAGVAVSVALAMLRILTGLPIMYLLVPGYLISIVLMFFTPPVFTSIAFDSGGVASGPMTATFLLPLAMGACEAVGGNVGQDAFGVVAMVAMTPLIAIQILGVLYKIRQSKQTTVKPEPAEDEIIQL